MTTEDIEKMPIEEIIHLPEFLSLESAGGFNINDAIYDRPIVAPHWKISFRATSIGGGKYKCFDREVIFPTLIIHKLKPNN